MRIGAGMWGIRLALLATLIVSMACAALFSITEAEARTVSTARADLVPGPSARGGGALAQTTVTLGRWLSGSPFEDTRNWSERQTGDSGISLVPAARLIESWDAGTGLPAWWEEAGVPGTGGPIPLWDLLAVSAMVVTFGILVGSWPRKGH